jgi:hypothetical protein
MLRQLVSSLFKLLLLACVATVVAMFTTIAWSITHAVPVALLAAAGVLTALGLALGAWVSSLFRHFDPSRDSPA